MSRSAAKLQDAWQQITSVTSALMLEGKMVITDCACNNHSVLDIVNIFSGWSLVKEAIAKLVRINLIGSNSNTFPRNHHVSTKCMTIILSGIH